MLEDPRLPLIDNTIIELGGMVGSVFKIAARMRDVRILIAILDHPNVVSHYSSSQKRGTVDRDLLTYVVREGYSEGIRTILGRGSVTGDSYVTAIAVAVEARSYSSLVTLLEYDNDGIGDRWLRCRSDYDQITAKMMQAK